MRRAAGQGGPWTLVQHGTAAHCCGQSFGMKSTSTGPHRKLMRTASYPGLDCVSLSQLRPLAYNSLKPEPSEVECVGRAGQEHLRHDHPGIALQSPRHRQHPSKRAEHMGRPTTRRCNRLSTRDLPVNSELRPVGRDLGAPVASAGLLDICKFAFVLRSSTVSPASNASKDTRAPAGTSTRLVGRARRCSACAAPTSRGPRAGRTVAGSPSRARRASATGRPSCTPEAPAPRARRWTELGVSPVTPDYFLLAKGSYTPRSPRIVKHRLQTPSIFLVTWS